jgi:AraC-like DNA-binding protein
LNTFSQLLFAWFPLLYLSVKYLISNHTRFDKKDLLHFIPMVLSIILFMDFYRLSGAEKLEMVRNPEGFYDAANMINEEILSIQGVVYSVIILIILKNYKERIVDFYANIDQSIIRWMQTGVLLILIAWVLGIIGTILERAQIDIGIDLFIFVYLFFVVIIYGISFVALRSGEVYKLKADSIRELISIDQRKRDLTGTTSSHTNQENNLEKSHPLPEDPLENELNERLVSLMEESKPYLNPDLSLQSLSEDLHVSRHRLSAIINARQGMNFFEFVNLYRINEVKELMQKDVSGKMKIYELAYDAGFNSKATFYRIFKQFSGETPSGFREKLNRINQPQA